MPTPHAIRREGEGKILGLSVSVSTLLTRDPRLESQHRQSSQCGRSVGNQPQFLYLPPIGKYPLGSHQPHISRRSKTVDARGTQSN
jgi:hypothetical protein